METFNKIMFAFGCIGTYDRINGLTVAYRGGHRNHQMAHNHQMARNHQMAINERANFPIEFFHSIPEMDMLKLVSSQAPSPHRHWFFGFSMD